MSRDALENTPVIITQEMRDRHLAEIYASVLKPGKDILGSLAELELMIAYPSDFYRGIVDDHFNPGKSGLSHALLEVNVSISPLMEWEKISLPYQKYHETLLLLLRKGVPAPRILAVLRDINPDYVRRVNDRLDRTAVSSLNILLSDLRSRGISDADILDLILPPSSAALRTVDSSTAAASAATSVDISPDLSSSAGSESPSLELAKEIFNKHLEEQTDKTPRLHNSSYPTLKLLTLFPDEDFHEKVVSLILNPQFLQDHQNQSPKSLYDLLEHLLNLGVPAERVLAALRTKIGPHDRVDYLDKLLSSRSYNNEARSLAFKFLAALAGKSSTIQTEILQWITHAESSLITSGDKSTIRTVSFESSFIGDYKNATKHSPAETSTIQAYLALIEALDPSHKLARKRIIYETLIKQARFKDGLKSIFESLDDHELVFEILRDDIVSQASAVTDNYYDQNGRLKSLFIAERLSAQAETSFEGLFALVKEIHTTRSSYTNGDLESLFLTLINLLKKDSRPENAAQQVIELLSSKVMSMFKNLSHNSTDKHEHLYAFFDLLDLLKEQAVSDTDIQKLGDSFSYNYIDYLDTPRKHSLAQEVNTLRFNGLRESYKLFLKMLSQNHLSNTLLATLANYSNYEGVISRDLDRYIMSLSQSEIYESSLKIIIGEGSLAKFYEKNADSRERKKDFITFIKTQGSRLFNDIKNSKFTNAELIKLAPFKDSLAAHIQSTGTDDEKFSLSLQAHDASTPLGRYFTLITHGSSDAIATKKVLSEPLAKILKDNIAKVYALLLSDILTVSQRKGLAFLKEEVAAYMKTLAEPQSFNDHVDAISEHSPLGQFFYQARDESYIGRATGLSKTDPSKGVLKNIVDELKSEKYGATRILGYITGDAVRIDQLASLARFEEDLVKHWEDNLEGEALWNLYKNALNHETAIGKYYVAANSFAPVSSTSAIMRNLNHLLAKKVNLFLEKIESGDIKRTIFTPTSLREIQDEFLKAMQRLPNDQCKAMLTQALNPEKKLQTFLGDRQKDLRDLQAKRSIVHGSTTAAGLFSASRSVAASATIGDCAARAGSGGPRPGTLGDDDL